MHDRCEEVAAELQVSHGEYGPHSQTAASAEMGYLLVFGSPCPLVLLELKGHRVTHLLLPSTSVN